MVKQVRVGEGRTRLLPIFQLLLQTIFSKAAYTDGMELPSSKAKTFRPEYRRLRAVELLKAGMKQAAIASSAYRYQRCPKGSQWLSGISWDKGLEALRYRENHKKPPCRLSQEQKR